MMPNHGYHIDDEVDLCYIRLNDAICSFERNTDIGATLVLIPHKGKTLVSMDGKPSHADAAAMKFAIEHAEAEQVRTNARQ